MDISFYVAPMGAVYAQGWQQEVRRHGIDIRYRAVRLLGPVEVTFYLGDEAVLGVVQETDVARRVVIEEPTEAQMEVLSALSAAGIVFGTVFHQDDEDAVLAA